MNINHSKFILVLDLMKFFTWHDNKIYNKTTSNQYFEYYNFDLEIFMCIEILRYG